MALLQVDENATLASTQWLSCYSEIELLYNTNSRSHFLAIGFVYTVGALLAITFNILFLVAIKRNRSLQKLSNYLLVCLSCIDLTTGYVVMPAASAILFGRSQHVKFCVLEKYTQSIGYTLTSMSFFVVLTITLDQYVAITNPFFYQNNVTFRKLFIPLVTLGVIMGIACMISWPNTDLWIYFQSFSGFTIVVTYTTVMYCYTRIFLIANHAKRKITANSIRRNRETATRKTANKTVITSFSIIIAFTISYVPIAIFTIRKLAFNISAVERTIVYEWVQLIAVYSSVVSPLVYYWRLRVVRRELYGLFKVKCMRTNSISPTTVRGSVRQMEIAQDGGV